MSIYSRGFNYKILCMCFWLIKWLILLENVLIHIPRTYLVSLNIVEFISFIFIFIKNFLNNTITYFQYEHNKHILIKIILKTWKFLFLFHNILDTVFLSINSVCLKIIKVYLCAKVFHFMQMKNRIYYCLII